MKKTIIALACLIASLLTAKAQIVITEIMYNPPPGGTDTLEYIELSNNTNASVNISNWHFIEGVTFSFPANTTVPVGGYVVVTENLAYFSARFPGVTAFQWDGALTNTPGEDIQISTSDSSQIVDIVDYRNGNPWPTGANGEGASIVLCDPDSDNSLPISWKAATTPTGVFIAGIQILANPGAASGCPSTIDAKNDLFKVLPNKPVTNLPVLANDILPDPNVTVTIVGAPLAASATVNPNNTIAYILSNPDYCGADLFSYSVCDASDCDTALVFINIPCYPSRTIAQMTAENNVTGVADSIGTSCELQGTVYGVNLRPTNGGQPSLLFTLIDDAGDGIAVSSLAGNFGYTVKEKDKIKVRGTIDQFNGLTEIQPDTVLKISENNPLLSPAVVVIANESTESKLIKINNLHFVDPAEWTTGAGASGFNVRVVSDDHPNDTILLRIDRDVELYNQPVPPQPFNLTGIGGQFDPTSPYSSGYQILPRYNPDISTLSAVQQADFSAHVRLAPNPVSDRLLFQTDVQFERICIFSASGILFKTLENPTFSEQIPVEMLPVGVYFIQFEKDGATWATRFVKM